MVFFLAGSVNSNGLEVAAAIAVWSSLLAILHWGDRHDEPDPSVARRAARDRGVGHGPHAVRSRPPSSEPSASSRSCRSRSPSVWRVAPRPSGAGGRRGRGRWSWCGGHDAPRQQRHGLRTPCGFEIGDRNPLILILGQTSVYVEGMIGTFGWLDTKPPLVTLLVSLGVALRVARSRSGPRDAPRRAQPGGGLRRRPRPAGGRAAAVGATPTACRGRGATRCRSPSACRCSPS